MENEHTIYMDKESYERYVKDIDKLIEEKKELDKKRNSVHKKGTDTAWDNAEFMALESECERLAVEIKRRRLNLSNIVLLNHQNNDKIVDFNDVLVLSLFDQYGNDKIIGKLVGNAQPNNKSDILEISVNSLIGRLIYGKKIGETIAYETNGITCYVQIVEKINSKQDEIGTSVVKKR